MKNLSNDHKYLMEATGLHKSFSDAGDVLHILKDVELKVGYNRTVAITGESGSGKSTLLHLLGLLDKPDSGEILYFTARKAFNDRQVSTFRNHNIGFVFQYHYLLEDLTAAENVAMPSFIKTGDWKKSVTSAKRLLAEMDLKQRTEHYPNRLSGGEQQRVAIARALINNPKMVLADEPTGNLDQRHSEEIIELIVKLNEKANCSLIIVTHNMEIAGQMDEQYLLDGGSLNKLS